MNDTKTPDTHPCVTEGPGSRVLAKPKTVLLVEDEPALLSVLHDVLRGAGLLAHATTQPSRAVAAVESGAITADLLLADMCLPEMRGDELALRLRRTLPKLEVILMSGLPSPSCAAVEYLEKPFEIETLLGAVHRRLAHADEVANDAQETDETL